MANLYTTTYGITGITVLKPFSWGETGSTGSAAGFLIGISVTVSGSTAGGAYDASAVSGTTALGPLITSIPAVTGFVPNLVMVPGWFFQNGLTIVPGTGMTVNVMYQ